MVTGDTVSPMITDKTSIMLGIKLANTIIGP